MHRREAKERLDWTPRLPDAFRSHYPLADYPQDRQMGIMWKYLVRQANCARAWVRINHHLPETLVSEPLDIIEFSTAHGAMLEVWREYGHRVTGTDYNWAVDGSGAAKPKITRPWHEKLLIDIDKTGHDHPKAERLEGWPYQPIIEAQGLDVRLFDGGQRPYPLEDKSFDVLCCYQAIEAYGPPETWLDILAEFCRIARQTIVVGFNPLPVGDADDPQVVEAARMAWIEMQNYNRNGFRTTFFEFGHTRRGFHPVCCKLSAI